MEIQDVCNYAQANRARIFFKLDENNQCMINPQGTLKVMISEEIRDLVIDTQKVFNEASEFDVRYYGVAGTTAMAILSRAELAERIGVSL